MSVLRQIDLPEKDQPLRADVSLLGSLVGEVLVESVLSHISDSLVAGETVKISSFGTFSVRDKAARVGRNPKTGEEVPILPRRVLTFRPSHLMKDRVAAGNKR